MEFEDIILNDKKLRVYRNGNVHHFRKGKYSHLIKEKPSRSKKYSKTTESNYIQITINKKNYYAHRIVAQTFLGLDIDNPQIEVHHKNHDTEDNSIENLELVSRSQNQFSRRNTKGYYWNKKLQKYKVQIQLDKKRIHGGYFVNEEDARNKYLELKAIYHNY